MTTKMFCYFVLKWDISVVREKPLSRLNQFKGIQLVQINGITRRD